MAGNLITSYQYDLYDNLVQVTMPRAAGTQTRSFTYNGKFLISATNPENGTVTYVYNGDQTPGHQDGRQRPEDRLRTYVTQTSA